VVFKVKYYAYVKHYKFPETMLEAETKINEIRPWGRDLVSRLHHCCILNYHSSPYYKF